jgi:recombination protein RecR
LAASAGPEIERLISLLSKLPGLGPRSARRAALALLKKRDQLLSPLADALAEAAARVKVCGTCGSLDTQDPCAICADHSRDPALVCVVEEVGALWAMERASAFRGRYHVLGGLLSALDGVGPEALRVNGLVTRATAVEVREVILALPATVDGQTTAHYLADRLAGSGVSVTMLARGVPVGGELDWLDDGTIAQAMRARRPA